MKILFNIFLRSKKVNKNAWMVYKIKMNLIIKVLWLKSKRKIKLKRPKCTLNRCKIWMTV